MYSVFTKQMFIEYLLYAGHLLGTWGYNIKLRVNNFALMYFQVMEGDRL